jgi:hypothetical protein
MFGYAEGEGDRIFSARDLRRELLGGYAPGALLCSLVSDSSRMSEEMARLKCSRQLRLSRPNRALWS